MKFERGNRIKVIAGSFKGLEGVIADIADSEYYENVDYDASYYVDIDGGGCGVLKYESELERIDGEVQGKLNLFEESLNKSGHICKTGFKIGDVVRAPGPNDSRFKNLYVVRECIEVDTDDGVKYMYDVSPVSEYLSHMVETFDESSMEYQYYDRNWKEYFIESVGNNLPKWRGKLYNLYTLYINPETHEYGELDNKLVKDYNNHTIPPAYMEHILRSHSVYERITDVFKSAENKKIMADNLNISVDDLTRLKDALRKKINARNTTDMDSEYKVDISSKAFPVFTKQELQFVSEIDKLDISKGKFKDHFPLEMTNLQIMQAIWEAYHNAHKVGQRKMHIVTDERTGEKSSPNKGKVLYEGITSNDMIIQFWYNFDLNIIETAYPVIMNGNVKKHGIL